jgi:transglutaminase-like putative cysteine protease
MIIRVGYDIVFELRAPTPMVVLLNLHPSRSADLPAPDRILTEPEVPIQEYIDVFGNRCGRLVAPAGTFRFYSTADVPDTGASDPIDRSAWQHPVEELPADTLQFLMASRYCEVDRMTDTAWKLFGSSSAQGWDRVQEICDWVHAHVRFDYQLTHPSKTALDVFNEGTGVCRDFQHLAITFCRALNIPARYATGYIPDIGVPVNGAMDFAAWFQVYLGGRWHTFDARNNTPRIGRILMATGRDAVDVALTTSFGQAILKQFVVISDEVVTPAPTLSIA